MVKKELPKFTTKSLRSISINWIDVEKKLPKFTSNFTKLPKFKEII